MIHFFHLIIQRQQMAYERVYDVPLLDDIHNYFPDIIYNSSRFTSVPILLAYIQERIRSRFNLFDYGRRQYAASIPQNTHIPYTHAQMHMPRTEFGMEFRTPERPSGVNPSINSTLFPILRSLAIPRVVRHGPIFEDVIVHASAEIIDGASTQTTLEQDLDIDCSICQDSMRQGELVRTLTVCEHKFHTSCIDNWLLNDSVICPVCRHDIREPARTRSLVTSPVIGPARGDFVGLAASLDAAAEAATPPHSQVQGVGVAGGPRSSLRQRDSTLDTLLSQELINTIFGGLGN
jgi:hypothetical protein